MKERFSTVLALLFLCICTQAQTIRYVKQTANGGSPSANGLSWGAASNDLQAMINASSAGDQVWVASRVNIPIRSANNITGVPIVSRFNAFLLKEGVKVYGGFPENGGSWADRNPATYVTTLTGEMNIGAIEDNNDANNAYHVVLAVGASDSPLSANTVLDGFTITGGRADDAFGIAVNGEVIDSNLGGGIYNRYSNATFANLVISGNKSNNYGGGVANEGSSPSLTNVIISGNLSRNAGGILNYESSSPTLTNVTICGNATTGEYGGVIYSSYYSYPRYNNCIIWGNNTGMTTDMTSSSYYWYCLVQGRYDSSSGNIPDTDPLFINAVPYQDAPTTAGNYRLVSNSPVVNAGNNQYYWDAVNGGAGLPLPGGMDLSGNARIVDQIIDMGAYESQVIRDIIPAPGNILYVDQNVTGGDGKGGSWNNAITELANALKYARSLNNYKSATPLKIYVAKGIYNPLYSADDDSYLANGNRFNSFVMVKNVQVYGGFDPAAGITELSHNRILPSSGQEGTVLSGDIGAAGENAYSVVIAAGDVGSAGLDGFTITGGNADLSSGSITVNEQVFQRNFGGGICNWRSSPVLTNLLITGNAASYLGAGIYNYFATPILTNAVITGNNSTVFGGGGYNVGSDIAMTNVTISGNTSGNNGKEWYNASGAPVVRNTIIWGNGVFGQLSDTQYSLVQNQTEAGNPGYFLAGNENLPPATNPQFVNPTGGDYRLSLSSPAINAGSNSAYGNLSGAKDLAGNPRLWGATIDMGAYENQDGSLPVTLVSFKAAQQENTVQLSWQTTGEVNASHFDIQRSSDAKSFEGIGSVAAKGSGKYTFSDNSPFDYAQGSPLSSAAAAALAYYRLKMIDLDGTYAYSEIRSVSFKKAGNVISQDNLYPNPSAKGMVILETADGQADPVIRIFDGLGREVPVRITGRGGKYFLETAGLLSGMYHVQVRDGEKRQTLQLVITD